MGFMTIHNCDGTSIKLQVMSPNLAALSLHMQSSHKFPTQASCSPNAQSSYHSRQSNILLLSNSLLLSILILITTPINHKVQFLLLTFSLNECKCNNRPILQP